MLTRLLIKCGRYDYEMRLERPTVAFQESKLRFDKNLEPVETFATEKLKSIFDSLREQPQQLLYEFEHKKELMRRPAVQRGLGRCFENQKVHLLTPNLSGRTKCATWAALAIRGHVGAGL